MALSEILEKFGTAVEPTISCNSLGNGAGRICALIDNTTVRAPRGFLGAQIKTGTSPTSNSFVRIFLIRQSAAANNVKGGGGALGDVDAAVSAEPNNAVCVWAFVVSSTSNVQYSEVIEVVAPGPKFSWVVWNASGVALNGTQTTPVLQWVPVTPESQ